jgi:kumamolisin
MRDFGGFQSVIQSGRTVSQTEMETRFLPLRADYNRVSAWLVDQGLTPTLVDSSHTNLFFCGTVARIAAAFQVSFARVATVDGEFTSAISAPSLPQELSSVVLGIEGLQPHIRMHAPKLQPDAATTTFVHPTRAIPADVLAAYNAPSNLNGAGQTIAIFTDFAPLASDLTTFWQDAGVNELNPTFTVVPVNGGPTSEGSQDEASLDAEWSTGMAPGANLRIYAAPTGGLADFVAACTQILNDGVAKIVSSSYSNSETSLAPASMQSCSQLLAQMAAAGITVFHGSGDDGSYGSSAAPEYPPTDPYVTALGGTAMTFDANWNETSEVVWPSTGGGYSTFFPQPSWQTGPGVPTGTMRCVPDAAAPASTISASGTIYSFVVVNGATNMGIGGDSLTGPIWAGVTAIINQARANAGLPTLGLLGPKIYPLIGTSAFYDITVGNNGAYNAGPGYDLCSGVGTPNVTNLIQALANEPLFLVQPSSQTIANGSTAVFNVSASGTPAPTLQWFLNGAAIAGATSSTLVMTGATAANAGSYTCVATNSITSVTSLPATLNLVTTSDPGRLINLSCRAQVGTGGDILISGFVVGGQGTSGSEPLLIRASGPALVPFDVSGTLPDPQLQVFSGNSQLAINNGWLGSSQIASTVAAVGAFAWSNASSHDSALVENLQGGPYTAQISGQSGDTGVALAEVYDATPAGTYTPSSPRLINLSARLQVGSGANILIAGFVVGGSTAKTVLVRASGPALIPFGVSGTLPDPELELFSGSSELTNNRGWGGNTQISSVAGAVGAFAWTNPLSNDSAILVTLPPGAYTAQVSGAGGDTGVALVELYEVP